MECTQKESKLPILLSDFKIIYTFFLQETVSRIPDKNKPCLPTRLITTQTQNKTRQNYYAIFLLCRGGIFTSLYIFAYLQVAIRRFAYIKHSDSYFVHEKRNKNVISSPCNLSESLPSTICECLTIGVHHQPTLIERILDIAQLHKNGSGSGMGKHV